MLLFYSYFVSINSSSSFSPSPSQRDSCIELVRAILKRARTAAWLRPLRPLRPCLSGRSLESCTPVVDTCCAMASSVLIIMLFFKKKVNKQTHLGGHTPTKPSRVPTNPRKLHACYTPLHDSFKGTNGYTTFICGPSSADSNVSFSLSALLCFGPLSQ